LLQCVAVCCSVLKCVAVCCKVLQDVAVCCSVLQCVAVCCGVLQCVAAYLRYSTPWKPRAEQLVFTPQPAPFFHSTLSHVTHISESCHIHKWFMSHTGMNRIILLQYVPTPHPALFLPSIPSDDLSARVIFPQQFWVKQQMRHVKQQWVMSSAGMSEGTHKNEWGHTQECVRLHTWGGFAQ